MSIEKAVYRVGDGKCVGKADILNWDCTREYGDLLYEPPTPVQVGQLILYAGWGQNEVARLTGVRIDEKKGSATVRRWKSESPSSSRAIPYSAWRLLLLHAGICTLS
ncbi:MAG: hypothetical protein JKY40_10540 [Gammaproteobacteria bacterium]|nr:hypothetical protein [Gammaproteobacteria bacterium]MBL4729723.1 hypothetical protein [Gammaproteobacteria bacterium]